jgi:acyl-coenzyme A thioesterase PaaI-like protein
VDYEAMKAGLGEAVPFVKTIGLEYVELGPGIATVRLPDRPEQANHVGSQHAGTLFTVAETASGGAFVSAFAERLGEVTPLAKSARISYEKIAKGPIDATATLADADGLLEALDEDGKVEFAIDVELKDAGGNRVATATVDWHVRKNDA